MALWLVAVCLIAVIGIVLAGIGWRGRRVDDHPLCRRCGFDLTGRAPDSTRCAECGADLAAPRAVSVGHRVRRAWLLGGGLVLAAPALLAITTFVVVQARGVDLTPYKPGWLLLRDFATGGVAGDVALNEFARRLQANALADHHVLAVSDHCLAHQADVKATWRPACGTFLEAAQSAGKLPREKWAAYARQTFAPQMTARPSVGQGDGVPISLNIASPRLAGAQFTALFDWEGIRIDDRPAGLPAGTGGVGVNGTGHAGKFAARGNGWGSTYYHPRVDKKVTAGLTPGPHRFYVRLRLKVFESRDVPETHDGRRVPIDPQKQLGTIEAELSAPFTVFEPSAAPAVVFHDESLRPKVEAAVQVRHVRPRAKQVEVSVNFNEPPARLAYVVSLRVPGVEKELTLGTCYAGKNSNNGFVYAAMGSLGGAKTVSVIFRPDEKHAREGVDATPVWGGEIVREVAVSPEEAKSP